MEGGIAYQDALKHILWRSILGFLPRTALVSNTPLHSFSENEYIYQKPLAHDLARSRGCVVPYFRTLSDMDVAPEPTRTCSWRVLK